MAYREIRKNRLKKFMDRVKIDPTTKCWTWTGPKTFGGYGVSSHKGKVHVAHKAFWLFLGNELPEKMDLDHLCRNRACINPDHLEVVTRSENLRRGFEARGCKNGHPYNEDDFSYIIGMKNGKPRFERRCKICHRERNKKSKRNKCL